MQGCSCHSSVEGSLKRAPSPSEEADFKVFKAREHGTEALPTKETQVLGVRRSWAWAWSLLRELLPSELFGGRNQPDCRPRSPPVPHLPAAWAFCARSSHRPAEVTTPCPRPCPCAPRCTEPVMTRSGTLLLRHLWSFLYIS